MKSFILSNENLDNCDALLMNPQTGRYRYGTFSRLINELMTRFFKSIEREDVDRAKVLQQFGLIEGLSDGLSDSKTPTANESEGDDHAH